MLKDLKVLLALGLVASAVMTVLAFGPATSQVPPERMTITLFEPNANSKEWDVNVGGKGFTPGDGGTSKGTQLDPETCEEIGLVAGQFTYLAPAGKENGYFSFNGGLLQDDGKIMFQFVSKFTDFEADGATGAVTGGTGVYKDARGDVTLVEKHQACDAKGTLATIDLLLQ